MARSSSAADPTRRPLAVLRVVVLVDLLGLTLVLPVLPFHTAALGGGGLWLGVVVAAFSAAQAAAAPVLGRLADRHGRRRMLLVSLAGSAASLASMALAPSLWALVAARLLAGACGGSIGVAHALAADLTPPEQRTRAMGQLGMSIGAAFTVGPLLGSAGTVTGLPAMALVGSALAALAWLLVWRLLDDTPAVPAPRRPAGSWRGLPWGLLAAGALSMCALVGMETTVAFQAADGFGAGPGFVGVLLCAAGLAMTVVQARPLQAAARRWGDRRVAVASALAMAAGLLAVPAANAPAMVLAVAVIAAGQGLLGATTASLLSRTGDPARRGELLGTAQSAAAAGRLVGPVGAGGLYDVGSGLPSLVGAALAALAAVAVGTGAARLPAGRPR